MNNIYFMLLVLEMLKPFGAGEISSHAPSPQSQTLRICVVDRQTHNLRIEVAYYNPQTKDTLLADGRKFSQAHPTTRPPYASPAAFFINGDPVVLSGRRYVKYGLPRVLATHEVIRRSSTHGVPAFVEAGLIGTPDIYYLPTRPGCEFQPYQLEIKTGAVRGE